jgi:hypothetical protein
LAAFNLRFFNRVQPIHRRVPQKMCIRGRRVSIARFLCGIRAPLTIPDLKYRFGVEKLTLCKSLFHPHEFCEFLTGAVLSKVLSGISVLPSGHSPSE